LKTRCSFWPHAASAASPTTAAALDSADLLMEVSRGINKWLWFVEAHLQAER
jgi:hypothetical protein